MENICDNKILLRALKFQRHLFLGVEMSMGLKVCEVSQLLHTLQIVWGILHQSVLVVIFLISNDLEVFSSLIYVWSAFFANASPYNSLVGKTILTVFPLNLNRVIVFTNILHQTTSNTTFPQDKWDRLIFLEHNSQRKLFH